METQPWLCPSETPVHLYFSQERLLKVCGIHILLVWHGLSFMGGLREQGLYALSEEEKMMSTKPIKKLSSNSWSTS